MVLIEDQSQTLRSVLLNYLSGDQQSPLSSFFSDFESIEWSLATDQNNNLKMSLRAPSIKAIAQKYDIHTEISKLCKLKLQKASPESGYDISFQVSMEEFKQADLQNDRIEEISLLRAMILSIPLRYAFKCLNNQVDGEQFTIPMRGSEAIYILPYADRIMTTFSVAFEDSSDAVLGKVFLQEFYDSRQKQTVQNAPIVIYGKEAPAEMAKYIKSSPADHAQLTYISFVLLPRHVTPEKEEKSISSLVNFRPYLHHQIKSTKAYLHNRMRGKVADFVKVLNRAKPNYELS